MFTVQVKPNYVSEWKTAKVTDDAAEAAKYQVSWEQMQGWDVRVLVNA